MPPPPRAARSVQCGLDRGDVEQALDHFGLLRAGDGMPAADDEARHAVDADAMGAEVFRMDDVEILVAGEQTAEAGGIEPRSGGDGAQHGGVTDIVAIGEMRGEQRLHHRVGRAEAGGEADQPVGVDRGGVRRMRSKRKARPSARPSSAIEA